MFSNIRSKMSFIKHMSVSSYCTLREARILRKMINSSQQKGNNFKYKKVGVANLKQYIPENLTNPKYQKKLDALNHVYLGYVVEAITILSNGNKLKELGINMFKVNFSKRSGMLYIYWFGNSDKIENTENIDETLSKIAVELRNEIGIIGKIGRPPFVKFVRDKSSENQVLVEKILEKPEFKKDLMVADTLCNMDLNIAEEIDTVIPKMKNDAYGVNYDELKERILDERKKSLRKPQEDEFKIENINEGLTIKFNKAVYEKFYRRKQAMREKELRHKESLIFNPADYINFEEMDKEVPFDWQYGEHGEIITDLGQRFKKFTTENQEMEKTKVEEKK